MSHHIYTTRGFILSLRKTSETDKSVSVFTHDLGLVYASARGVRKLGSKLSHHLSELSLVEISLVRGKRHWRVTSVSLVENLPFTLRDRRDALEVLYKISALLSKLIHGEEKHPELYDELEVLVMMLVKDKHINPTAWELYAVSRLLSHLGYLSKLEVAENLNDALSRKGVLVGLINEGIRSSGLQ